MPKIYLGCVTAGLPACLILSNSKLIIITGAEVLGTLMTYQGTLREGEGQ